MMNGGFRSIFHGSLVVAGLSVPALGAVEIALVGNIYKASFLVLALEFLMS